MLEVPTKEPVELTAGENWEWDKTLSDFLPSDGWVLKYALRGPVDADFTADDDGHSYEIRVPFATTAAYTPGSYKLVGYVELDDDRHVIFDARVTVRPNPLTAVNAGTQNEQILAVIEAALSGRLTTDMESYQINGRAVNKISIETLEKLRGRYLLNVELERRPHARIRHAATFSNA